MALIHPRLWCRTFLFPVFYDWEWSCKSVVPNLCSSARWLHYFTLVIHNMLIQALSLWYSSWHLINNVDNFWAFVNTFLSFDALSSLINSLPNSKFNFSSITTYHSSLYFITIFSYLKTLQPNFILVIAGSMSFISYTIALSVLLQMLKHS